MKLIFAKGHPNFRWFPSFVRWGTHLSMFWLGREVVLRWGREATFSGYAKSATFNGHPCVRKGADPGYEAVKE